MSIKIDNMKREKNNEGIYKIFEDKKITVDKLLDVVDMELSWYVPSDDAIKFMIFLRLVLGEEPENSNPKAHYFMMDCIFKSPNVVRYFEERGINFERLKKKIVILCTREFSKSVLITFLMLFMADEGRMPGFGRVNYGIYVSDSMRNGVKNTFNTLEKVYLSSKYLRSRFEDVRFTDSEMNLTRKPRTKKEIELYEQHVVIEGNKPNTCPDRMKRTFSVKGVGAETGTRGTREALSRPQFAIFDDLIASEKDAESDTILENIDSTIDSDVMKGLSGNGHFAILIGTPYNKKDPVYRRIEEGTWLPVVFPRAREMYAGIKEEDFQSVWPDRHRYENCVYDFEDAMTAKDKGNSVPMRKLMQEHYLRISSDEDRMVSDKMINWYSRSKLMNKLSQYNLYMTTDFTTTGNSGSDLSGTAMWALGSNGDYFMLDISLRKKELVEQYNDVFAMIRTWHRYNYRGVTAGVELDGGQRAHIQALKDRMVERNEWFTIGSQRGAKIGSEGIMSRLEGGNKHWRFRMTLPLFQNRKIWFPEELREDPDMKELIEELEYVTYRGFGSKFDDGIDLISQLMMLETITPPATFDEDEFDSKPLKKRSGMWAHHIEYGDEGDNGAYSTYID